MSLKILRRLETKRAPERKDRVGGGRYTPSGIDIYTTDQPGLVRFSEYDQYSVRVADLLAILDELDTYERRLKLDGEKMDIHLDMVTPESKHGDVYHQPGFLIARPDPERMGLVCLDVFSGRSFGAITLTADRRSLRRALEKNLAELAELEQQDRAKYGETRR